MEANREKETILGTSQIDPRYRITLVQPLPELLGVDIGDLIVFARDERGNVVIRASSISKLAPRVAKRKKARPPATPPG